MTLRARPLAAAALATLLGASAARAGASSTPFQPDPALLTASKADLEGRVRRACTITQARLQSTAETSLERPCGCYATRTLRSMSPSEIEAYRTTGYFDDATRAKALAAIDSCRLKRPV